MTELVTFTYVEASAPAAARLIVDAVERLSGRRRLANLYRDYDRRRDFFDAAVEALDLRLQLSGLATQKTPASGPLVIVANHPFGVVDGLALAHILGQRRQDLRIIANDLLTRAPEAAARLFPIDFAETRSARQTNLDTRRRAQDWLNQGGAILIFPAGGVSSAPALGKRVVDERWKPFTGKLIHQTKSAVLPIFTHGRNSWLFQLANLIHPTARAACLLNEVRNKIGQEIHIHLGQVINYDAMAQLTDRQELVDALCAHTYALGRLSSPTSRPADDMAWDWADETAAATM